MQTPQNPVQELLALYGQQRFADMERKARGLLKQGASAPILDELLGMALAAQRRFSDALPLLKKAADTAPNDAQFQENLGNCQRELGEFADAEKSLRKSLAIRQGGVDTMNALASVLRAQNKRAEARELFEKILAQAPNHAFVRFNFGNLLKEEGQAAAAEEQFRLALAANPNIAVFHEELAIVLMVLGRQLDAENSLRKAMTLSPPSPRSFALLANLLATGLRRLEAVQCADAALRMIGGVTPDLIAKNVGLFSLLAESYSTAGDHDSAVKIYKELNKVDPGLESALASYGSLRATCDWEAAKAVDAKILAALRGGISLGPHGGKIFVVPPATASDQLIAMKQMSATFEKAEARPVNVLRHERDRRAERLRIGYLSSDFRDHVISHLIAGVIEAHDKNKFEIIACDNSPASEDDYRRRLEAAFERRLPLTGLSNERAAQLIADNVDVLVDLMGWTEGHRAPVLAVRPAPVQIYWLGIAGTTGAPWIDYNVADRVVIPPDLDDHYSEKIIRLPDCYLPTDIKKRVGPSLSRSDCNLPASGIVFCSFNQVFKLTVEIFDVWMRLLNDVPRSVLWMQEPSVTAVAALRTRASRRGVDPDRIIFASRMPKLSDHLGRAATADIALDSFPYGSHTTAADMLLAGVPLVSLMGETFASRVSASVLNAANLPDLVTSSYEDYYALALKLATDHQALDQVKQRTRDARNSVLFDTARFTRHLEIGYRLAWERYLAGMPPTNIDVPAT